ncbi:MAG: heavy metal translocating P-type ATPase [candidate division WOR-3 bacterium]
MKTCECSTCEIEKRVNVRKELILIFSGSFLFFFGFIFEKKLHHFSIFEYLVFLTGYFLTGYNVLLKAIRNIFKGKFFDENSLLSFATIGAILIHELPEALLVMLLFKIGDFLENISINKSRKRIKALIEQKPSLANLKIDNNRIENIPVERLKSGDIIIVRPGEKIPVDGKILKGQSLLDMSALTGEFVPKRKREGDEVLAGMINNGEGVLEIEVTREFKESYISRILKMVEIAEERKSRTEKLITKFARYYTPVVFIIALSIMILPPIFLKESFSKYFYRGLVLLIISCPCALVISVPFSYFITIGVLAKKGILVKGANFIDAIRNVKTIIFDKTGTLTEGVFEVIDVKSFNGFKNDEIIKFSAYAEFYSNHPIGASIKKKYKGNFDLSLIKNHKEIAGLGVFAEVSGKKIFVGNDRFLHENGIEHKLCIGEGITVHVIIDGIHAGYFVISDKLKKEAKECVLFLKKEGIKVGMLTGDNEFFAKMVAERLNLDFYKAGLLPSEKLEEIEKIVEKSKGKIAFVGDGINDAPSIKRADVGIVMGALGQDIAIENGDVVIMSDSLLKIPEFLKISKNTKKIVLENIIFALSMKIFLTVLGSIGIAGMFSAIFADMGVLLIVLLNSMRIIK